MKTLPLILSISLISLSLPAQDESYTSVMLSSIEKMHQAEMLNQAEKTASLMESANQFERIALAEKIRWLPYYYSSYSLIMMSFDEIDGGKKDLLLDRAQEMLDKAMELEAKESELHVLQAFLYPSRILVDPMGRGMIYMELMFTSLETAKSLNPENPRSYFLLGVNKANLPPSFGGGAEVAKPILEEAITRFEAYNHPGPLWPNWGETAARAELEKLQ